jgi:hypothetical protein
MSSPFVSFLSEDGAEQAEIHSGKGDENEEKSPEKR